MLPARTRVCPAILRALYSEVLNRIEQRGFDVYQGRVSLATRQKLWLAGRIWTGTTFKSLLPGKGPLS